MDQNSNLHNTNALLLGTCEFSFSEGAATHAAALALGYRDMGNVIGYSINPSSDLKEHVGCYRGVTRVDASRVINARLAYKLQLDEFSLQNVAFLFMGTAQADWVQATTTGAADSLPFVAGTPMKIGYWYDLRRGGVRVRSILTITITGFAKDTDYELDAEQGRIRFLTTTLTDTARTTPVSVVIPTLTNSSIVAGSAKSMKVLTPLLQTRRSGMARLGVFDGASANYIALSHEDFSCDITLDGNVDGGSTDYGKFSLNVLVTSIPGSVLVRETGAGTLL